VDLALGTVQFGLAYGIAGRSTQVPEEEVRRILACAAERGIRVLDTASAYGDIEQRLGSLIADCEAKVVSKIRPRPDLMDSRSVKSWARAEVLRSIERIGPSLYALMFHRPEDLLDAQGEDLWHACAETTREHGIRLGVSCYDPATLQSVSDRFPIAVAQLPANALDQRLARCPDNMAMPSEIHVRSVFLQGLLLMPQSAALARLPVAARALRRWQGWCTQEGMAPLKAALGIVKGIKTATHCVVGVDGLKQLKDIADAWEQAPALHAPELHEPDLQIIDPRQWTRKAA